MIEMLINKNDETNVKLLTAQDTLRLRLSCAQHVINKELSSVDDHKIK